MMFQRLARNFVKNGYFPTDAVTLSRILFALAPATEGKITICDPTAGEGVALAECKQHLGADRVQAYGVELNEERAYHAKILLDHCVHGDLMDCVITRQSVGLLFFNPPYGDLNRDQTGNAVRTMGRDRLEKSLYRRAVACVQSGGVMVMIIPDRTLDKEFAFTLSRNWQRVQVFLAPEQQYRQIVFFGVRGAPELDEAKAVCQQLIDIGEGDQPPELPAVWSQTPYLVPAATAELTIQVNRLDAKQLAVEIEHSPCLWRQFTQRFERESQPPRRPLTDLSQWHLALALAAGQVSGLVRHPQDGRAYLVRGSTYKQVVEEIQWLEGESGTQTECRIQREHFVPVLRALDVTPNSPTYGQVLTLK